jgi:hypothetical protein
VAQFTQGEAASGFSRRAFAVFFFEPMLGEHQAVFEATKKFAYRVDSRIFTYSLRHNSTVERVGINYDRLNDG